MGDTKGKEKWKGRAGSLKGAVADTLAELDEYRYRIVIGLLLVLAVGWVGWTISGAIEGNELSAKNLAVLALCTSLISATAGSLNFILSRFRLLGIREISASLNDHVIHGMTWEFSVDVASYGAPIHDVNVFLRFEVPRTKGTVEKGISGTYRMRLDPLGERRDPLSSGQGQTFIMTASVGRDAKRDPNSWDLRSFLAASPRDISLLVYCDGGRKLLRQIRSPYLHWRLDCYYANAKGLRCPWWQEWRSNREIKRLLKRIEDCPVTTATEACKSSP